jgi:hypothetical protein
MMVGPGHSGHDGGSVVSHLRVLLEDMSPAFVVEDDAAALAVLLLEEDSGISHRNR